MEDECGGERKRERREREKGERRERKIKCEKRKECQQWTEIPPRGPERGMAPVPANDFF